MSRKLMYLVIVKMHKRLNSLIIENNFNLQHEKVQHYSRRLDKVLTHYNKSIMDKRLKSLSEM